MKRIILSLFLLVISLHIAPSVSALNILPPDEIANPSALFGQDHAYTVTFRGNGEGIVNLRVAFTNSGEEDQTTLTYRVPRVEPQDMVAYQVIREPQCVRYGSVADECIEYQNPDYYDTYWYGNTSYLKTEVQYEADTITITLPEGVAPNKTGSILLYFRANRYTKKGSFGSYDYLFESLKSDESIRNLQVGITTDSQLKLKNPDSDINYRFEGDFAPAQGMMAESKMMVSNSSALDNYYQQIGQGSVVKYATYLQPLDSFTVEGAYADATWKLYAKAIMISVAVFIVILSVLAFALLKIIKLIRGRKHETSQSHSTGSSALFMALASFVASLLAAGYTVVIFMLNSFMNNWNYSPMNMLLMLLVVILSFGIYPLVLFGPSFIIGRMRGMWWGAGTFALTLMWLMFYVFILVGYIWIANPRQNQYDGGIDIMPMIKAEPQVF